MHASLSQAGKLIIRLRWRRALTVWSSSCTVFPWRPVKSSIFHVGSSVGIVFRREGGARVACVVVRVEMVALWSGSILIWIRGLVFEHLDELVEAGCK
jgi:hypothetical protein